MAFNCMQRDRHRKWERRDVQKEQGTGAAVEIYV